MTSKQFIIDTNYILRYLLADIKDQHQAASKFFQDVRAGKIKAIVKEAVLTEVIFVLSSHYKVPRDKIVKVLSHFLIYKGILLDNKDIIMSALDIYQHSNLHIVDSILAAHAKLHSVELMTFDNGLKKHITSSSNE